MERIFLSSNGTYWVAAGYGTEAFQWGLVVVTLSYTQWQSTGCTSQVSWVQFPVTASLFTFPLFCLITFKNSSILANSHSYLNYFFCILACNDLAYHNHGEERLSVMEGPQSHSKEHQVRKQECKWQPVKGKSTENKVNQLLINTISLFPMLWMLTDNLLSKIL